MTIRRILSAMMRRWYIPLGVLACAALLMVMLARDGGIYTTKTVVAFTLPATTSLSRVNGMSDANIIAFAAAVVRETNNGRAPARYSMDDSPYYGAGIREGELVDLANSGNQWVSSVNQAEIEIQVVGRTHAAVKTRQQALVSKVMSAAESQQTSVGIPKRVRIRTSVVPLTTEIAYVAASRRGQVAAGAALLAAAIIIGAWGSVVVDRRLLGRRSIGGRSIPRTPSRTAEGLTT